MTGKSTPPTLDYDVMFRLAKLMTSSQLTELARACEAVNDAGAGYGVVTVTFHAGHAKEFGAQFTLRPSDGS